MKNLAVRVTADIGGYTSNMSLVPRLAREHMGNAAGAVDAFQSNVDRSAAAVGQAARTMGGNMRAANDAIAKSASAAAEAVESVAVAANEADFRSFGDKVKEAMTTGAAAGKTRWDEFYTWAEGKAKITAIAIGIAMAAVGLGAVYTAYKVVSASLGFLKGLITGESYQSSNIDALIAANNQVKALQESMGLTAAQAIATQAAIDRFGESVQTRIAVLKAAETAMFANRDALDALGVEYRDANGDLVSTERFIGNANAKLREYTEGWDRNQAAQAIGIGTAAQVAAAVALTSEKLTEAKERLDAYNLGIGEETQAAVTRYEDAMRVFNHETTLTSEGFKRAIADNIMPALTDLAEFFSSGWPSVVNIFRYSIASITLVFYQLKTGVYTVAESILGSIQSITYGLVGLNTAFAKALRGDVSGAKDALLQGWNDAKDRLAEVGANIRAQVDHNRDAVKQAFAMDDRAAAPAQGKRFFGTWWGDEGTPSSGDTAKPKLERDDVAKAVMEGALKQEEAFINAERQQLQARQHFLQAYYQQEYITAADHFDTRRRLVLDNLSVELAAYDREIAALEAFRETREKDRDRQDADNRIAEVRAKRDAAQAKANTELAQSWLERLGIQRQFDLQTREWDRTLGLANEQLAFEIGLMGRSSIEVAKASAARRIQLDLEERIYQIRRKDPGADVSEAVASATQRTLDAQQLIERQAEKQRDGWFGAEQAVRKYIESVDQLGAQVEGALTNSFRAAEDAVLQFVRKGKLDVKSLVDTIITEFARIEIRRNLIGPAARAIEDAGGFSGILGRLFGTSSDQPDLLGYTPAQLESLGVPSYDVGTNYVPRTQLAVVHQGEQITREGQNGFGNLTMANTYHIEAGADRAALKAYIDAKDSDTLNRVADMTRRGGSFPRSVRG